MSKFNTNTEKVYTRKMESPFTSIRVLVIIAAIIGILIASVIVLGTSDISYTQAKNTAPATSSTSVDNKIISTTTSSTTALTNTPNKPAASSTKTHVSTATVSTTTANTTASSTIHLSLSINPSQIEEGDPVMITLNGSTTVANIKSTVLIAPGPNTAGAEASTSLLFFNYQNKPVAFYGTGINQTPGKTTVILTMKNGTEISGDFTIIARARPNESLPVPAQLGGNSISSQQQLVKNLDTENIELTNVYSNPHTSFWTTPFSWPIHSTDISDGIVITDSFGYNRDSGAETIIHKGSDFKAAPGTPIYAINAGYVRVTKLFSVYGNTIVIDHGMGIESFYMHLSKMVVKPGDAIKKGQLIGYSGETGYSEGPHLHLTVRIGGVSIDPVKFYALFGLVPDSTLAN